jgi:hypothetical protein
MHHVLLRRRWHNAQAGTTFPAGVYVCGVDISYRLAARAINEGHAVLLEDYDAAEDAMPSKKVH